MRWNGTAAFVAACILAMAALVSVTAVTITPQLAFASTYAVSATTAPAQHSGHLGTAFGEGIAKALSMPEASM